MRIFLSWSGSKSRLITAKLSEWLPQVIQSIQPYYTPTDIDKGSRWATEISNELSSCNFGLIIVTKDNSTAPWLNFEAGALSKNISQSRACPILIDVKSSEINGPLANFQHTTFDRDDIFQLIKNINSLMDSGKISEAILTRSFDTFWPDLESSVNEILKSSDKSTTVKRSEREILEEVLDRVRLISRFPANRYNRKEIPFHIVAGLHNTSRKLVSLNETSSPEVLKELRPLIAELHPTLEFIQSYLEQISDDRIPPWIKSPKNSGAVKRESKLSDKNLMVSETDD